MRYGYTGWDVGEDVTPEETGKEWLTIGPIDDDGYIDGELATIVLRTNASIFDGNPELLDEHRKQRETSAQRIVDALNAFEEAGHEISLSSGEPVGPHIIYDTTPPPVDPAKGTELALIHPASDESVKRVLNAPVNSGDGRSNWVWVRLMNTDLILGVYPQGDTYFAVEEDAQFPDVP